jgi:hypothetical protein
MSKKISNSLGKSAKEGVDTSQLFIYSQQQHHVWHSNLKFPFYGHPKKKKMSFGIKRCRRKEQDSPNRIV